MYKYIICMYKCVICTNYKCILYINYIIYIYMCVFTIYKNILYIKHISVCIMQFTYINTCFQTAVYIFPKMFFIYICFIYIVTHTHLYNIYI